MGAQIEVDPDAGVVTGRGEIDMAAADDLRAAISSAFDVDRSRTVVVDLRDVTFIDSTGVKELLRPVVEGFSLALRRPSGPVRRVLELSGLTDTVAIEQA
jgi:anti-anti-sigma factor